MVELLEAFKSLSPFWIQSPGIRNQVKIAMNGELLCLICKITQISTFLQYVAG